MVWMKSSLPLDQKVAGNCSTAFKSAASSYRVRASASHNSGTVTVRLTASATLYTPGFPSTGSDFAIFRPPSKMTSS